MSTAITVRNLGKKYNIGSLNVNDTFRDSLNNILTLKWNKGHKEPFWALKDVNFDINKGDSLGIIGRNGAGKSTLLKILSQITAPTTGAITINGRIASLLEVGTGFHPELSGRENIFLNGSILGMSRKEIMNKFDAIVDFSEVEQFLETPVKRYSSGMYVKLAFAVAAHLDPEILIVDEVLAVGDLKFQKKCLGKMSEVGKDGRTVIFVSHNMSAVKSLCTRALYLENGKCVYDGSVLTATSKYQGRTEAKNLIKIWDENAPTVRTLRLREVSINNSADGENGELSTEKPLIIKIKFETLDDNSLAGTTVFFYNSGGDMLFASLSNHEKKWHGKKRPKGTYVNTCEIPANFFADGDYSISVGLWGGFYEYGIVEDGVLNISLHEEGFIRADIPYESNSGLVKPLLKWESEKINYDKR